jgi:hypothetical protein
MFSHAYLDDLSERVRYFMAHSNGIRDFTPLEEISLRRFKDGRSRRYGRSNPEKFNNAFWDARVQGSWDNVSERVDHTKRLYSAEAPDVDFRNRGAFHAALEFVQQRFEKFMEEGLNIRDGDERIRSDSIWGHTRILQPMASLPDGRIVRIGAEHGGFFDPDFQAYNNVIVFRREAGSAKGISVNNFEIYGYPKEVFPLTDGHTATLLPSQEGILILGGNMSTAEAETDASCVDSGNTPIYLLDLGTWEILRVETTGQGPGIIWGHKAVLQGSVLYVTAQASDASMAKAQRRVMVSGEMNTVQVLKDEAWSLNLETLVWRRQGWQAMTKV